MGIINLTPDSFSNDGFSYNIENALEQAKKMVDKGADIIDVGGESSKPGALPVSEAEELKRVIPFIKELSKVIDKPISIDTYKSTVAREALKAGAQIINDISALSADNNMVDVVVKNKTPVILMHMKGTPSDMQINPNYEDPVLEIIDFFKKKIDESVKKGIKRENIILDPGIGFGKTIKHNLEILNRLEEFCELHCPILIGASRKSFVGKITGKPLEQRLPGSLAIATIAILHKANLIRVHDVEETVDVAKICDAVRNSENIKLDVY